MRLVRWTWIQGRQWRKDQSPKTTKKAVLNALIYAVADKKRFHLQLHNHEHHPSCLWDNLCAQSRGAGHPLGYGIWQDISSIMVSWAFGPARYFLIGSPPRLDGRALSRQLWVVQQHNNKKEGLLPSKVRIKVLYMRNKSASSNKVSIYEIADKSVNKGAKSANMQIKSR